MRNALGKTVRRTPFAREIDEDLEALRDDCIALFLNSGLKQKDIAAAGGPTSATISRWLYKETMFPRYQTIASFVRVLGCKLTVIDKNTVILNQDKGSASWQGDRRPKMPVRKARK